MKEDYGEGTTFWMQEAEGEYVKYEGLIYPHFDPALHVEPLPEGLEFETVVAGVDWGWANPFVILVLGITRLGEVWVLDETYETEKSTDWITERSRALKKQWGIQTFYADPSEPTMIEDMRVSGLNYTKANNEVITGLGAVNGLFKNNRIRIVQDACPNLEDELEEYRWKQTATGEPKPDEPLKEGDHAPDCLRYGWNSHLTKPHDFMELM